MIAHVVVIGCSFVYGGPVAQAESQEKDQAGVREAAQDTAPGGTTEEQRRQWRERD